MIAARASLLALLVCWAFAAAADVAVPPLSGRVVDQTGTLSASDISALTQNAEKSRNAQGQPGRGADRCDHGARDDRAVFDPGRRSLEDRAQEDR